jgi:hypothetical protein
MKTPGRRRIDVTVASHVSGERWTHAPIRYVAGRGPYRSGRRPDDDDVNEYYLYGTPTHLNMKHPYNSSLKSRLKGNANNGPQQTQ